MFSLLKSQILKPFLQFTKNLSADQLNLSIMKGEGSLKNLDLNEATMMSLLNLPTWLNLQKASCANISFKIRWTKLDSRPVIVMIDQIDIDLEVLTEPRPAEDNILPSYRTGSGKYALADRVVDGATVLINAVNINFCAPAFRACIEISRVALVSKTPAWGDGTLNQTSLHLPSADAVLVFKQLGWESIRIVADGSLNELSGIPVKLIANSGRVRLTLKKRLSDASLIGTRFYVLLDDLLWIFTLSQLKACIIFLRSLQHSIFLSEEQRKRFAVSRAKRQTLGLSNAATASPGGTSAKDQQSSAARLFRHHDVTETSYHLCLLRTELHFCDETKSDDGDTSVPNGYIQIHVYDAEIDWYPYHIEGPSHIRWPGSSEFQRSLKTWLEGDSAYTMQTQHLSSVQLTGIADDSPLHSKFTPSLLHSLTVLRVADMDVSLVSFPGTNSSSRQKATDDLCNEIPLHNNLFVGSDKKLHCLPTNTYLLTVEHCSSYIPYNDEKQEHPKSQHDTKVLPCVLFGQLKPIYLRFDADTIIWLNSFLITLNQNLDIFVKYQELWTSNEDMSEQRCYHIRVEALMPRVILPLEPRDLISSRSERDLKPPDVLVIQADEFVLQRLLPPLPHSAVVSLERLTQNSPIPMLDPRPQLGRVPGKVLNAAVFAQSVDSQDKTESDTSYFCLHVPHLWAEFLIKKGQTSGCDPKHSSQPIIYRQCLLDPVPLTSWFSLSVRKNSGFYLEVLLDVDNITHPLDESVCYTDELGDTINVQLGAYPTWTLSTSGSAFTAYPTAIDHLVLLLDLVYRVSFVLDRLSLGNLQALQQQSCIESTLNELWLVCYLKVERRLEIRLFPSNRQSTATDIVQFAENRCENAPDPNLEVESTSKSPFSDRHVSSDSKINELSDWENAMNRFNLRTGSQVNLPRGSIDSVGLIGSQGDLLDNQTFNLTDDSSSCSDNLSLIYGNGTLNFQSPLSNPDVDVDETGIDVLETYSLSESQTMDDASKGPVEHKLVKPSPLDRFQTLQEPVVDSYPLVSIQNISVCADASSSELRAWINLGQLDLADSESSYMPPSDVDPLWSFFCSSTSNLEQDGTNSRLHNEVCLFGDLLRNWSVTVQFSLRRLIVSLTDTLPRVFAQDLHANSPSVQCGESTCKIQSLISLKQGHLRLKLMNSGEDVKRIHLKQGLCVSYSEDGTLHIGQTVTEPQSDPDKSDMSGQNRGAEIAFLRKEVERLNTQLAQLQAERESHNRTVSQSNS